MVNFVVLTLFIFHSHYLSRFKFVLIRTDCDDLFLFTPTTPVFIITWMIKEDERQILAIFLQQLALNLPVEEVLAAA